MRSSSWRRAVPTALLMVAVVAGCAARPGIGPDGRSIDAVALAEQGRVSLVDGGNRVDRVTCAAGLPATPGATVRCTVSLGQRSWGATVTSTGSVADELTFDVVVDDEPIT